MDTGKFFFKQFIYFVILIGFLLVLSIGLLLFNLWRVYFYNGTAEEPSEIYIEIRDEEKFNLSHMSKETAKLLDERSVWAMTLNNSGEIIDSYKIPSEVDKVYSIGDVVRFTRWYLEDYPVFTYVYEDGVLVLGFPKGSYEKLPGNYYNVNVYVNLIKGLGVILLIDLLLIFVYYFYSKNKVNREIAPIREGIERLSKGEEVNLPTEGELSDLKSELNRASEIIEMDKRQREQWIRGISHDIRTPLTMILGHSANLLEEMDSKELRIIYENSVLIESILGDMNLNYSLDKFVLDRSKIYMQGMLRKVVSDIINSHDANIEVELGEKEIFYYGNEVLLERAIRNIILNSIEHNECPKIVLSLSVVESAIEIDICDDGEIVEGKVRELNADRITSDGNSGYGTMITKKIVQLHGGSVQYKYISPGLMTKIKLYKN